MSEIRKVSIDDKNGNSEVLSIASQKNMVVGNYIRIYVNASTGNDNTGTGESTAPYQTLNKALSLLNDNSYSEYRIYLSSGTYDFPQNIKTISNVSIHFVCDEENTIINLSTDINCAFYNCHIRFAPSASKQADYNSQTYAQMDSNNRRFIRVNFIGGSSYNNAVYFEGGTVGFDYCYVSSNKPIGLFGVYCTANRSHFFAPLYLRGTAFNCRGGVFSQNNTFNYTDENMINSQNSKIYLYPFDTRKDSESGSVVSSDNDGRTIFNLLDKSLTAIGIYFNSQYACPYSVYCGNVPSGHTELFKINYSSAHGNYRGLWTAGSQAPQHYTAVKSTVVL